MFLGHVSGRKVVPDCRRLGSSASDCRLQKGYPLCACQHTDTRATNSKFSRPRLLPSLTMTGSNSNSNYSVVESSYTSINF